MVNPISQSATFNDLFNKLNEVITELSILDDKIGDLSELDTIHQEDLVSAINEKGVSFITTLILEE